MTLITEDELFADWEAGSKAVFDTYERLARQHAAMPVKTGRLAAGHQVTNRRIAFPVSTATVETTARSPEGADYGSIIDQATGRTIRPVNKKALANEASGWGPYASARQSTKHRGWFDKVNSASVWSGALAELSRFGF